MNPAIHPLSVEQQQQISDLRYDFIRQAFGDEIARVSRLPLEERYRYVAWMIDNGKKHVREPRGVTL